MSAYLKNSWQSWCRFWFEADGREQMRVLRGFLGSILLIFYSIRSLDLDLYFGRDGLMPLAAVSEVVPMDYRQSVFFWMSGHGALVLWNGVFLVSLAMLALGIIPRLAAILAFALHVSFLHRNMSVVYGVDSISTFFLFSMCLANFNRVTMLGSVAYRLAQIQLCIIYGYSGLEKMRGTLWWSGEAMWHVFANPQLTRYDFSWMSKFPLLMVGMDYASLFWEIYFPALIWLRKWRYPLLVYGALMHLGIGIAMNIAFFATLMAGSYSVFLFEADARRIRRFFTDFFILPKVLRPVSEEMIV